MNSLVLKNDNQIGVAHVVSLWFESGVCTQAVSVASLEGGICWPVYPKLRLLSALGRTGSSAAGQELGRHEPLGQNL